MRFPAPRPAFGAGPRLSFGRRPPGDGLPAPHTDRAAARRTAQLAEAADALAVLPGPGEAVNVLLTGRYDMAHVLARVIDRLGPADCLRVATLSYNARNLTELLALLDGAKVRRLTLLASKFFAEHNGALWERTLEEFRGRGQRAAAARSHAKVALLAFPCGRRLTMAGSANLRSNGNVENLALTDGAGLHDWFAAWLDCTVAAHEGAEGGSP
jgi:hypothetical protein